MQTLTWAEIRRRYGIDVPVLRKLDPCVSCAVIRASGVFWFAGRTTREPAVEMFLICLLRASGEAEFLYVDFDESKVPMHLSGGRLSQAENLMTGAVTGASGPSRRQFVFRPMCAGGGLGTRN